MFLGDAKPTIKTGKNGRLTNRGGEEMGIYFLAAYSKPRAALNRVKDALRLMLARSPLALRPPLIP